jgi:acyl-CoA thioester hydrolase
MGVAHHASYAPWLEMGRTELLRAAGVSYAGLERDGVFMVIVKLDIRYRRPVRYDDVVEVRTRRAGGGKVKIEHEYEVVIIEPGEHGPRGEDRRGVVASVASTTLACVDRDGRPRALPDWLAE